MPYTLVVGSLAYDTIFAPEEKVNKCLGGSASYFSLAATLPCKILECFIHRMDLAKDAIEQWFPGFKEMLILG